MLAFQSKSSVIVQRVRVRASRGIKGRKRNVCGLLCHMNSPLNTEGELEDLQIVIWTRKTWSTYPGSFRVWMKSLLSCEMCREERMTASWYNREEATGEESASFTLVINNPLANAGDMRCRFSPWVGKIPWRRKWQPTPVFLPRESLG